ncbi:unnamed protein product [Kluyveromyces dobzhanskii CBS 2104]|uniref:WGS project CCBQ000000000 data, contig 00016 n=1 Tax=Kluyveromyces dobzhanskii CBS 2104 TaxID=1427455 RepID=A0A0A8KZP0_9SACH|nr:unnamed protein product [Kluyveromyces dobzhanskii CBS 2104]
MKVEKEEEEDRQLQSQQRAYVSALKRELTAKQELLRQSREACNAAERELEPDAVNYGAWEQLSQKQIYTSSRSDPIGIASLKQSLQIDVQQSVFDKSTEFLVSMINKQKKFNKDMSLLIVMLEENLRNEENDKNQLNSGETYQLRQIKETRTKIFSLLRDHMAVDVSTPEYSSTVAAADLTQLMRRLISGDSSLTIDDFEPGCMHLFRMLDKAYLLQKREVNGTMYLTMEDMT